MGSSSPDSSVHGILQARLLEWTFASPGDVPDPWIKCTSPALQVDSFPSEPPGKPKSIGCLVNSQKETHLLLVSFPQGFKGVRRESEFCRVNRRITECSVWKQGDFLLVFRKHLAVPVSLYGANEQPGVFQCWARGFPVATC